MHIAPNYNTSKITGVNLRNIPLFPTSQLPHIPSFLPFQLKVGFVEHHPVFFWHVNTL
jgi:hypothetical protein